MVGARAERAGGWAREPNGRGGGRESHFFSHHSGENGRLNTGRLSEL